jgi:hypothetical protein
MTVTLEFPFLGVDKPDLPISIKTLAPTLAHRALVFFALQRHAHAERSPPLYEHEQTRYALEQLYQELIVGKVFPSFEVFHEMRDTFVIALTSQVFSEKTMFAWDFETRTVSVAKCFPAKKT